MGQWSDFSVTSLMFVNNNTRSMDSGLLRKTILAANRTIKQEFWVQLCCQQIVVRSQAGYMTSLQHPCYNTWRSGPFDFQVSSVSYFYGNLQEGPELLAFQISPQPLLKCFIWLLKWPAKTSLLQMILFILHSGKSNPRSMSPAFTSRCSWAAGSY